MSKPKSYKRLLTVIKLTVFSACLSLGLHYLLTHDIQWSHLHLDSSALFLLPLVLCLAIVNWGLEAFKWKTLLNNVQAISYKTAVKATLSGVSTSFITPFRFGDFLGRVAHLQNNRKVASILTFYGNYSQLYTTFLFGTIAFIGLGSEYMGIRAEQFPLYQVLISIMLLALSILLFFPLNIYRALRLESIIKVQSGLETLSTSNLLLVLMMSMLRYLCFVSQYVFCFWIFGSSLDFATTWYLISLLYLLITFVPSPILGKLGVRESAALFLFDGIEASNIVLAASLSIWMVNLFIPAMMGSVYLLRTKQKEEAWK